MSKEAQIVRGLRNVLLASVVIGIPIMNRDVTGRVLKALSGQSVDCSSGEAADKNYPYDLIAVFGAGTYMDGSGNPQPSTFQRERLKAAAEAYVRGYAPKILLLDGGDQVTIQVSIAYLKTQVKDLSLNTKDLDDSLIEVDPNSINTATNAEDLLTYVIAHDIKKVLSITHKSHSGRAGTLACDYGVNSEMMTVEEFFPDLVRANPNKMVALKEELETLSLIYDPLGKLSIPIKEAINSANGQ